MNEETTVNEFQRLLAVCLSRIEEGQASALEDVCRQHPDHAARLRAGIRSLVDAGMVEAPLRPSLPKVLGDFRLVEPIGEGGMGTVYLARQESLGRDVALKVIRGDQTHLAHTRARFRREVDAVARMKHPSIVPVYAFGEDQGFPYFAMERIDGVSVQRLLRTFRGRSPAEVSAEDLRRALPIPPSSESNAGADRLSSFRSFALSVASDIASALGHAHDRGVLHRDVKPSNILIDSFGRAFLVDFGLATTAGPGELTQTGSRLGSLPYMSPEQVRGDPADERTDVYGLGATLYEMLTLEAPFGTDHAELLPARILEEEPVSPRRRNRALSRDDEAVCLRMLEKHPERRYPSAGDALADLENLVARRPVNARRVTWALRTVRFAQRRPAAAIAILLAFVVVVIGPLTIAYLSHRSRQDLAAANDRLREQYERAERNLRHARVAVERVVQEVGSEMLQGVPYMDALKHRVKRLAADLYETLLEQDPTDPTMRLEMAYIRRGLADIYRDLGRPQARDEAYRRVLADLRDLMQEPSVAAEAYGQAGAVASMIATGMIEGGDREGGDALWRETDDLFAESLALRDDGVIWMHWANSLARKAMTYMARGDGDAAEESMALAMERLDRAVATVKDPSLIAETRVMVLAGRGMLALNRGAAEDAVPDLRAAEEFMRARLEGHEAVWHAHAEYVSLANNLGLALRSAGESEEAAAALTRAIEVGERLAEAFPSLRSIRTDTASAWLNLGLVRGDQGDVAGKRTAYIRCVEMFRALLDDRPGDPDVEHPLALALSNLAYVELENDPAAALASAEEAKRRLDDLVGVRLHTQLERHWNTANALVARARIATGALAEARELLQELMARESEDPYLFRGLAEVWLVLHEAAIGDDPLRALAMERALYSLERAIALGFDDATDLMEAEELSPLRKNGDLDVLIRRLQ